MLEDQNSSTHDKIAKALRAAAGIIHNLVKNTDAPKRLKIESEDIVNEFYLFLLEYDARPLDLYEGRNGAQFGSYVGRIFFYWLNRRLKSKVSSEVTLTDVMSARLSDNRNSIADESENNLLYGALRKCIAQLENPEKEIINAYLDHEPKLSKISRKLGIAQAQIYVMWESTKKKIRSCLESKGFDRQLAVFNG